MRRSELEDERTFLLRSLEDLDREHDAGDLSDEDHAVLRDGYLARTAVVLKTLDGESAPSDGPVPASRRRRALPPTPTAGDRPRITRRRRRLVVAGLVVVIGCALLSVVAHVGPRLPGESVTGSVTLTPTQQAARTLVEAETLESRGDDVDAVKLYQTVLRQEPRQEQALAELGWLEYAAGAQSGNATLLALGEGHERTARQLDPGDFAPHLYLGSMLLAQNEPVAAVAQYRLFLADHPPKAKVQAAVPFIVKAFAGAHLPPPPLPVGRTTTTTKG